MTSRSNHKIISPCKIWMRVDLNNVSHVHVDIFIPTQFLVGESKTFALVFLNPMCLSTTFFLFKPPVVLSVCRYNRGCCRTMEESQEALAMAQCLEALGATPSGIQYFCSEYKTTALLCATFASLRAGEAPKMCSSSATTDDWRHLAHLYGCLVILHSRDISFAAIDVPRISKMQARLRHKPDERLLEFLQHLGILESQFQFLRWAYGLHCKDGLLLLLPKLANVSADSSCKHISKNTQYMLSWCIRYLDDSIGGTDYNFKYGCKHGHACPQGPFNLEILRMHSFRMFCCSLNVSPADIFRIYTQYGTLDYQQLSYGILHGPDVFNDSHGVNFGPISIHANMNFEGRHKLQVAIVWLEGLESAYGRDLIKTCCSTEPNPFLRFENFDVHRFEQWCKDNTLSDSGIYVPCQARCTAEVLPRYQIHDVPLPATSQPPSIKKRSCLPDNFSE